MNSTCGMASCTSDAAARGLCWKHYRRNLRHGDPNVTKWKTGCETEGCKEKHYGHGLCRMHLYEYKKSRKVVQFQGQ